MVAAYSLPSVVCEVQVSCLVQMNVTACSGRLLQLPRGCGHGRGYPGRHLHIELREQPNLYV